MTLSVNDAVALAWRDLQDLHLRLLNKPELSRDPDYVAEMFEAHELFAKVYGEWAEA